MDKIKLVLDFLKKYLFWFIFAATVVVVLIFWWMSTKSLANSFQLQKLKVEKKFSEVKEVSDDTLHPTPEYIKAIKNEDENGNLKECKLKDLKEGVLSVWKTLYDEQKKNNRWPDILGSEFINIVDKLDPNERIPENQRDRYKYVIKNYFPVLYKIIDLRHLSETAEGGGGGNVAPAPRQIMGYRIPVLGLGGRRPTGGTEDSTADWVGTVSWDQTDRQHLEERFDWRTTPDSDVIRLRQEDLWVYKALLEVIKETNNEGSPKDPVVVANVKRIESIQIGADAIGAWTAADQSVFKAPEVTAAAAAAAGASPRSAPIPTTRDTSTTAPDSKEQLLKDRYVDDKGAPLDADAKGLYSEFKMMPVSLKLHMDQRKISKLLAACVNSPMPIEVRRVRIRPGAGEILEPGGATAQAAGPSPAGLGGGAYRHMETRGPGRTPGAAAGGEESETGSNDIPLEIQGIIYIYNPPDLNTLGTGTAMEKPGEAAADAGAAGAKP